ncbi:MAG: tRNA (adenosine(37)-N6)-threonylcarbamoyltransferase complex dimerization subunit type 1 TsaB [Shinella sp.]|nr:tRNA (adenosine(37)-N6)-threonylcarbamoyltransferase complex dimerization subunit type 1 TsaB [Shinella sp.]
MIVLAIDTAGTGCFACVYDSDADAVLGEAGADIGRGHAERLMEFVDQALAEAGKALPDIERLAVTIGPGSFTGIRVGVAAVRGFALALGIPSVGVSTLEVLAEDHLARQPGRPVLVAMDAKRGEVYCQTFSAGGTAAGEPEVLALQDAVARFSDYDGMIVGSAATLLRGEAEAAADRFPASTVARLAATAEPNGRKPKPLYLRGPDAKPQAGFSIARA